MTRWQTTIRGSDAICWGSFVTPTYELPRADGFEVCKGFKKQLQPEVPVVLLTGRTSRIDRLRGTLSAADHYLTKPLQRAELMETLHHYFPQKEPFAKRLKPDERRPLVGRRVV